MQEVCDRVGIMAHGKMVREGRLDDLTAVENQTEITLENASAALLAQIEQLVKANGGGAKLLSSGKPRTTLERLFLEATDEKS
jgi:ABC-2 type transport system ATP-binding protein